MKPVLSMTDVKNSVSDSPVVLTEMVTPQPKNTKKYLIIGVSVVLVVAIALAAILIGMHFFTEAQADLINDTFNVNKDTKQNMTTDPTDNSIQYDISNPSFQMLVIDDFSHDIQTLKIKTDSGTNCYVIPLNRTSATDPSKIKTPENMPLTVMQNYTEELKYEVSGTPVADSSFLGKKARDACQGISVYWMYPKCDGKDSTAVQKRSCYYRYYYYYYYCYYGYGYYYYYYLCYRILWTYACY